MILSRAIAEKTKNMQCLSSLRLSSVVGVLTVVSESISWRLSRVFSDFQVFFSGESFVLRCYVVKKRFVTFFE